MKPATALTLLRVLGALIALPSLFFILAAVVAVMSVLGDQKWSVAAVTLLPAPVLLWFIYVGWRTWVNTTPAAVRQVFGSLAFCVLGIAFHFIKTSVVDAEAQAGWGMGCLGVAYVAYRLFAAYFIARIFVDGEPLASSGRAQAALSRLKGSCVHLLQAGGRGLRRRPVQLALIAVMLAGGLLLLSASGVGRQSYNDCLWEASKRPTVLGVNMAADACDMEFNR